MRLVLIDDRIDDYNNIIRTLTPDTDFIVFHYYTDTIDDIIRQITSRYDSVGIIQHKIDIPTYQLLDSMTMSTLYDVETKDPNLTTWNSYIEFLTWLAKGYNVQNIDLISCKLWNDPDWIYIVQKIQATIGINVRASIDVTKSIGDFVLESHPNIDTIGLYFTKQIVQYKYLFASIGTEYLALPSITPDNLYRNVATDITYTVVDEIQQAFINGTYNLYVKSINEPIGTLVSTFTPTSGNTYTYTFGNVAISSLGRSSFTIQDDTDPSNNTIISMFDISVLYEYNSDVSFVHVPVQTIDIVPDTPNRYRLMIRGLTNAEDYLVFLKSTNFMGDSGYYSAGSVHPFSVPSSPTIVSTVPLVASIFVDFRRSSFDGGNTITSYTYSLDNTNFTPLSITDVSNQSFTIPNLINGNSYTIYLNSNNARGNSATVASEPTIPFDIPDPPIFNSVDPSFGSFIVRFSEPIFDGGNAITYEYSLTTYDYNSSPVIADISPYKTLTSVEVINRTFTINNLTNEYSYVISFRTVNARGNSAPIATEEIVPDFTVPDTPILGILIPLESSIQIDFNSPEFNGGNSISSYAYSMDSGNTYTSLSQIEFANRAFTVNQLNNGTPYVFYIVAINARGQSHPLITISITPFVIPDTPLFTSVISQSRTIVIGFSLPAFDGGNTITKYAYSLDNTDYIPLSTTDVSNQSFSISNLTNGNTYTIYLEAFNARGNSIPAITEPVVPFTIPDSPSVNQLIPLVNSFQVYFSPPLNNGGNAVAGYAYAIKNDATDYTSQYTEITTTDISYQSFTVNSLTNGNSYTLYFVAINSRGNSRPNIINGIVPYTIPLAPTFQTLVSTDSAIQVFFNPPSFNGGNTISSYSYSIDSGYTYKPIIQTPSDVSTNSFTISNLANGNSYVVYLEAFNARGNSSPAISEPVVPFTIPDHPVVNQLIPLDSYIQVYFSPPLNNGGNAVAGYAYAIKNDTSDYTSQYTEITATDISYQSFTVNSLTNGNSYTLYFVAMNSRGNSRPNIINGIVPYTIPLAPTFRSIVSLDSAFKVFFNAPLFDGGNAITKYIYSMNGGNTYSQITQSTSDVSNQSFTAGNLTNGTSYVVYLSAVNARGNSAPAISTPFIPFTIPNPPTIYSVVPTLDSIQVRFSFPTTNGGNAITSYGYSLDGNSFVTLTNEDVRYRQFAVNGLIPGSQYTIYMNAVNARGNSLPGISHPVMTLQSIYRNIPSIVTYSVNDGEPIATIGNTYYLYNGNTYLSTFTPTAVTNPYVYVFANTRVSTIGYTTFTIRDVSSQSSLFDIASFTRIVQPGAPGALTFVSAADFSNNRFRISGLKNGVSYIVLVKAKNILGNSINYSFTSTIPFTVPDLPIIQTIEPLSGSVKIGFADPSFNGGNAITAYSYSTDRGNTYTLIRPMDISNYSFTTGILTSGNSYVVYLKAFNARGYSLPAVTSPFVPFREPDPPLSVSVTGLNHMVRVDFSPPLFDGGNAITSYVYSYDYGTTYNSVYANVRSFYIPNLSNGKPYNIYLKSVNARGISLPYISATVIPNKSLNTIYRNVSGTIRYIVGDLNMLANTGTRYELYVQGNNMALSSFVPTENTLEYIFGSVVVSQVGYTTFYIKYTPETTSNTTSIPVTVASFSEFVQYNNTYTELSFQLAPLLSLNTNTIDVTGLTDGQQYIVFVKSTNARGDSIYYSFASAVPYREPDAPTEVTVTPLNQSIQFDFLPPSFNGGNTISSYVYSYDYGTNYYRIDATVRSVFIPNLSNGRPYNIYLKAVNARGESAPYISAVVVPSKSNNSIYQNVNSTVRYMVPNKRIPNVVGTPDITYALYLSGSNIPISQFTSIYDPHEYVFGNVLISKIGYVTFDIKDITTPHPTTLYPQTIYSFTEFVSYSNNASLVFKTATPSPTVPNAIVIYGLIDGQQYIVFVKSSNARGDSVYYSFISEVPYREPDAPVFTTTVPLVGGIQVGFSAPYFNGGNTITSYAYSVDGGNTYASIAQTDIQNGTFTVGNLTNGTPYVIYLKAQNSRDYSVPRLSLPVVPFTVPDAPLFRSVIPSLDSILVDYADPVFNGGNTITSYAYSIDGGNTYVPVNADDFRYKQFVIDTLTMGTTYIIYLKAFNARGNSAPVISYPIVTLSKIYRNIPARVTYTINIDDQNAQSALVGKTYKLYTDNVVLSTFTPTNGTNPFTYIFNNVSVTTLGKHTFSIRDVTIPESPILVSSFSRFVYTQSEFYKPLSFVQPTDISNNKFRVSGLQNGTSYIVFVKARNINGSSTNYSFTSTIPFTVPDPPQFDSIVPLVGSIQVGFSDPEFNGGNAITSYDYTVTKDGGNTFSSYIKLTANEFNNRSFLIDGLANGNAYSIYLRGYNARGNSLPIISGPVISFTVPSPPLITQVTPLDRSIRVLFSETFNGGNTITSYEYSYDFGATYSVAMVTSGNTFIVPNLLNDLPYFIYLKAKNARGYSAPSVSTEVAPRADIIITDSSFQNIYQNVKTTIHYFVNNPTATEKLAKSGNTYALCIGNTSLSTFTPPNGNTFEYVFGNVVVSTFGSTVFNIKDISNNGSTVLFFTKFVEYQYQPQLSYVSVAVPSNGSNTIQIPGLMDGQQYVVFIKAINNQGDSLYYSYISQKPYREPDPPTIQSVIPNDRSVQVSFTKPAFDGGNDITSYEYSYDFGATYYVATLTNENTFIVPNMLNDVPYYIYLKAKNARGYSIPSVSSAVTPRSNIILTDSSNQDIYQNVKTTVQYLVTDHTSTTTLAKSGNTYALFIGSNRLSIFTPSSNTYDYVFGNVLVTTFGSTDFTIKDISNNGITVLSFTKFVVFQYQSELSFVSVPVPYDDSNAIQIPGLLNGQQYVVFIKAVNAQGETPYYSFISQKPYREPDSPTIQLVTPKDRYMEVSFSKPAFDGGNTITQYEYSYDFGTKYLVANVTNGNSFIVPNLVNDRPYYIYLKAKNARGYSRPYISSGAIPRQYILTTDISSHDIYQNVKTTLRYLDNAQLNTARIAKSGNTYALCIGNTSLSTFTPTNGDTFEYVFGNVVVHTFGNTIFNIKDINNNGSAVLSFTKFVLYQYQSDLSFALIAVPKDDRLNLSGLTDGQQYLVFIKSTNLKGDSPYYSFTSEKPFREPDSPIIQSVTPNDSSVEVSFAKPAFDGGNTITAYEYSYDFGANYSVASITNGNSFTVPGLINDLPYYIYLKAKNARGYSEPFVSSFVSPKRRPNLLETIYQNRKTTVHYVVNNNVPSYLNKKAKSGNTYALSIGNTSLSTFIPTGDTFEYVFGNVVVPIFGNTAFTISDITTVRSTTVMLTFYAVVLYEYESELSFITVPSLLDNTNTIQIPGLVNGQRYDIFIKSVNTQGDSEFYSFTSGKPYRLPDPPVIEYLTPNDASIDVFFNPPFDGGNPITSYSYAYTTSGSPQQGNINGSALTYTTFETREDGLYRIPNLTNGISYTVFVKSNNLRGSSVASDSKTIAPFSVPFSPSIYRLKPSDSTIAVYFTEPANGGNTITDYIYSINSTDAQDYISMGRYPATTATYLITGLTNYTQYTIRVKAVNARGNSLASVPAIVKTSLVPYPPTIYELIPQISAIDILFSTPNDGGNPIIDYTYSVNGSEFVSMNRTATNDIYRITDLSNDVPYTISIQAINIAGNSVSSDSKTTVPFDIPDSPSIVSIDPSSKSGVVVYSPPQWNGGNTITGYKYSLNSGPLVNAIILSDDPTKFIINATTTSVYKLVNGTEYSVELFAINARGHSFPSIVKSFTPRTIPDAPTSVRIIESNQSVAVSFITAYDGGNTIVGYAYSLNGIMTSELYTNSRFTIDGLVNGRTYTLGLHAKNYVGYSEYYQSIIPYSTPDKPIVTTIIPDDGKVTVEFDGLNGGRDMLTTYSINNGNFIQLGLDRLNTYIFDITELPNGTRLQNGTTYSIRIQTINLAGNSPISDTYYITPYTKPKPPTIRNIVPGIEELTVFFTPNADDGGNTVTQYEYTYNSYTGIVEYSSISLFDPSFVISNLTYGITYNVRIRAINFAGASGLSNEVSGIPVDVPVAPRLNDIVSTDRQLTVYFTKGDPRGKDAETCKYNVYNSFGVALDSREFQTDPNLMDASFVLTDILGSPLINGFRYYIDIQNRNSVGYSAPSNREYDIPCRPPMPPIFLTNLGVNRLATITFKHNPDTGGAELTDILVSFTDATRFIDKQSIGLDITTLKFRLLNNKTIYKLQLYAVNPAGISAPAEIDLISYEDPASLKYIQQNSTLNPNGSMSASHRHAGVVGRSRGNTRYV